MDNTGAGQNFTGRYFTGPNFTDIIFNMFSHVKQEAHEAHEVLQTDRRMHKIF
jgi:hypothetical protein